MLKSRNDKLQSNTGFGGKWKNASGEFPEAEKLALIATFCLGLDISGVDLLFKEDGSFVICEVNQNSDLYFYNEKERMRAVKIIIEMFKEKLEMLEANE
jgi:glutathione synthase/RimK-type ligase-like ATP-grasp enzyme